MKLIKINKIESHTINNIDICIFSFNRVHTYDSITNADFKILIDCNNYYLEIFGNKKEKYQFTGEGLQVLSKYQHCFIIEEDKKHGDINYIASITSNAI